MNDLRNDFVAAILIVLCLLAAISFARDAEIAIMKQTLTGKKQ